MRILYVWDAEYPWDVRTEKVCMALTHGRHDVVITARNRRAQPLREPRPEGVVERLAAGPAWARRWISFPAFFNPVWLRHLHRLIRRYRIEVIVVRDLPLAPPALLAARGRMPVVFDMAENYPAMIRDIWTDRRQRPFDILVRNPRLVAAVERFVLARADHVITVIEESRQRVITLGVRPERVSVVSNTPSAARVTPIRTRSPGEVLRLVYLGLMEKHRGIGCSLDASAILKDEGLPFHLDLIGDGRDLDAIRDHAAARGLTGEEVTFHGRLPHSQAIALVTRAHVGLVPHEARESWNTTIPNKLFDYMAAGLAVISSDAVPAARVVRSTGAGFVFRSGDGGHLARVIRECLDIPAWERHSRAGQEAIRSEYNWETDSRRLLEVVSAIGVGEVLAGPELAG